MQSQNPKSHAKPFSLQKPQCRILNPQHECQALKQKMATLRKNKGFGQANREPSEQRQNQPPKGFTSQAETNKKWQPNPNCLKGAAHPQPGKTHENPAA